MSGERVSPTGFRAFLATQALGAFNDNAFRFALLFAIKAAADGPDESRLTGAAQALFAVPFVLFAAWSGTLADRVGKSRIIVMAKVVEILVMGLGVLAFASGSTAGLLCVLFLMSTQSTFFGPAKYGWVAETVPEEDLARANGLVQMTTMLAIVAGQVAGGNLFDAYKDDLASGAWLFVAVAALGTFTASFVTRVKASRPEATFSGNPFGDLKETWRAVRVDRRLLYTMLGIGHFFLLVALLQIDLLDYGEELLGLEEGLSARLVATAVVGIAVGSVLAGRLSEGRVELGLVPLGAVAMSVGVFALAVCEPVPLDVAWLSENALADELFRRGLWLPVGLVLLTGLAGGFFIVPLYALLQLRAPADQKGRYLAFGNLVSFAGIGIASVFLWLPNELGMGIRGQFLMIAALSLVGTVITLRLLPNAFVRFLAWMLAHTVYRIRVRFEDRLPERGGGLLVANHVSWVDALILAVSSRRQLHFLMHRPYYEWKPTHWLFRMMGCIPIASGDAPEVVDASLRAAGERLDEGRLVVIFAEGSVTRLGRMLPLRTGYQRIMEGRKSPIIPVHLGGLWGSIFSHAGGRLLWKRPRELPYPVSVTFGEPLPPDTSPEAVREAVRALGVEAWHEREHAGEPLDVAMRRKRSRSLRARLHESGRRSLSIARLHARAMALATPLRRELERAPGDGNGRVGLIARPGLDAATFLVALSRLGRTVVPLERADAAERLHAADVHVVLAEPEPETAATTAKPFPDHVTVIPMRPLLAKVSRVGETLRLLAGILLPTRLRMLGRGVASSAPLAPAATVFPRVGPPRLLSHENILSAADGLAQVLELDRRRDGLLGVLPFSSAYGLVTTLWFPLLSGTHIAWAPVGSDGADGKDGAVGKIVQRFGLNVLPATPEALEGAFQRARSGQLGSLRLVLCGDGPLDDATHALFTDRFGIEPTGVFTSTACTGLLSLNTPDVRSAGHYQRGTREGSLGHPLPRVLLEIIDPDTGEVLPRGTVGALRVRGACLTGQLVDGQSTEPPDFVDLPDRGRMDEHGFLYLEGVARTTGVSPASSRTARAQPGSGDGPASDPDHPATR